MHFESCRVKDSSYKPCLPGTPTQCNAAVFCTIYSHFGLVSGHSFASCYGATAITCCLHCWPPQFRPATTCTRSPAFRQKSVCTANVNDGKLDKACTVISDSEYELVAACTCGRQHGLHGSKEWPLSKLKQLKILTNFISEIRTIMGSVQNKEYKIYKICKMTLPNYFFKNVMLRGGES